MTQLNRRGFLTGFAAGAVGWVVGGGAGGTGAVPSAYAQPVRFVVPPEMVPAVLAQAVTDPDAQAATFPQSVASGDPNPHGAIIWTRVDPSAVTAEAGSQVGWQVASDPGFGAGTVLLQGVATIEASRDNTIKLPIQNAALKPFTLYYYRFFYNGIASRTGRFKTLPPAGASLDQLKIGYVVCQDYSNGFYNAYGFLAQEEVDVVVHLGDYIYEYLDDGVGGPDNGPVRVVPPFPLGGQYPQGLADYRHLYQVYRADPQLQAAHERFAFILLWDDHEFFNDCHQDFHEDTNPPGLSATSPQPALRQAATQAWCEHGLADVKFDPTKPWDKSVKVYRTVEFGNLLNLVITDERLYRDGPPCGDVDIGERYETNGCANQFNPDRTMLGTTQRKWFLQQMTKSRARWNVWANEVMLCQYLLPNPSTSAIQFFDLDQWDGYPVERASILADIKAAGVQNFVVLSGDAHLFLASYLKINFNDPSEQPMGVELMVGAISSGNYLDSAVDAPSRVPLSAPTPAVLAGKIAASVDAAEPIVRAINPHIQFWNGATWGYGLLTVTAAQMVCEFRVPSTVKQNQDGSVTLGELARFTVPTGQVNLIAG